MRRLSLTGILTLIPLVGLLTTGCKDRAVDQPAAEIAVTNSYLASAVRDLCGDGTEVMSLAPPGMCPGHFDISPVQVNRLRHCRALLLFDFQAPVVASLTRLKDKGLKTHLVQGPTGLCVPDSYLATCHAVAAILTDQYPERASELTQRLKAIAQRLDSLSSELQAQVQTAAVVDAPILSSNHQVKFAQWLGLQSVATFVGSDSETVSNIDHCLKRAAGSDVRFVIANQQEGTALARALADRLKARAVVFSNFPAHGEEGPGFDRLLRDNVGRLLGTVVP